MARNIVSVRVVGEARAIEALTGVSEEAARAQRSAMKKAGTAAARICRRGYAGEFSGIPVKVWRKRVQAFAQRRRGPLAVHKLWSGLRKPPSYNEHPKVASAIKSKHPRGFEAKMRPGHVGWFERVGKERLPIKEHTLRVDEKARGIILSAAREALEDVYVAELRRQFRRRMKTLARRTARGLLR